ncbi:uncharacterized protein LOC142341299 [Convolutriloba macropyga]|uniref:uncharacterized protein LOC142341299 n=1 Tax=Convolutriloba macropyga TaxID=536237 RepID=UPI003F51F598
MACFITVVASFDTETMCYEGCPTDNYYETYVTAMFLSLRCLYPLIAILVYLMICRIYEHSLGVACIVIGALFVTFAFISQTGEALEFFRMFLELPIRFFGTAYIQAFSLAVIFNWAFFGLELRKFYRIWLCAFKGTVTVPGGIIPS